GLDYHWDTSPKDIQAVVFRKQIRLAKRLKMPIIIHNREATDDVIKIFQEENAQEIGGIMHCYSATREEAQPVLDLNFHISLEGPVSYKNAHEVKEVAPLITLDRLFIETDAPFFVPNPNRGKRNEPAYVKLVAEEIARLREMDVSELAEVTLDNACRFFGISH